MPTCRPEELVSEVLATDTTRIPLWRDKPENIIGVLHAKDLLRAIRAAEGDTSKIDVSTIALPPWFVPEMRPRIGTAESIPPPQDSFRAGGRRNTGEVEGMVSAGRHSGGNRRRYFRRA